MNSTVNCSINRPVFRWSFIAAISVCCVSLVQAHPAEQGLILLLPTDIYISAGVAAFALTVVLVGLLPSAATDTLFKTLLLTKLPNCSKIILATSACSTVFVLFLVLVGSIGPLDPKANLLSLTIWSGWWIGLVLLQGLIGNVWHWINPWAGLLTMLDGVLKPSNRPVIPKALGVWPAVLIFLSFSLFSIVDPTPADPTRLAQLTFSYWIMTTLGMMIFGYQPWATHFECFTLFFKLISRISPFQYGSELRVGFPGWALVNDRKSSYSLAIFCLVILGAGSFDGLGETFWWLAKIGVNPLEFPGRSAIVAETVFGFFVVNLSLCLAFGVCVFLGVYLANNGSETNSSVPFRPVFVQQALAMLPIGFGFHFAHFLPTFLVDSQYNLAALTDPFGTGADYLSLGKINIYVGFLSVSSIVHRLWLTQAGIVVLTHVIAVLIAHRTSKVLFSTRRKALLAELPMSVFMFFYTGFGLWLLAAPRGA